MAGGLRQVSLQSSRVRATGGILKEVPSEALDEVYASGVRTLGLADQAIRTGDLESAATGGFRMGDVRRPTR